MAHLKFIMLPPNIGIFFSVIKIIWKYSADVLFRREIKFKKGEMFGSTSKKMLFLEGSPKNLKERENNFE